MTLDIATIHRYMPKSRIAEVKKLCYSKSITQSIC